MKTVWGWSLAVIGATGVCHAADSDPVAGVVARASGGWQDTKHSRVLERGSDVLQNASIVRTEPPAPDAEIEIYLLDGSVIKRSCAKGACANPIEIKSSQQDTPDLLKIIKDLLFSPEEQPVPAATMAATSGLDPTRVQTASINTPRVPDFAAGVVAESGDITNVILSRKPSTLAAAVSTLKGSPRNSPWPVKEMFRVTSAGDDSSAPSYATLCGGVKGSLAFCDRQHAAPGTYAISSWRIYLFESPAQVDCLSDAIEVGKLLTQWQFSTDDTSRRAQLAEKATQYADTRAAACRR